MSSIFLQFHGALCNLLPPSLAPNLLPSPSPSLPLSLAFHRHLTSDCFPLIAWLLSFPAPPPPHLPLLPSDPRPHSVCGHTRRLRVGAGHFGGREETPVTRWVRVWVWACVSSFFHVLLTCLNSQLLNRDYSMLVSNLTHCCHHCISSRFSLI